jgi:hypothetical protein
LQPKVLDQEQVKKQPMGGLLCGIALRYFPAKQATGRKGWRMYSHANDFDLWYQEQCDRLYWSQGQCCAGCDHWISEAGMTGRCSAAGVVSGEDVLKSMGIAFSNYTPPPGFPFVRATFHCGKFSDEFDWSALSEMYLYSIGAMRRGKLHPKPSCP